MIPTDLDPFERDYLLRMAARHPDSLAWRGQVDVGTRRTLIVRGLMCYSCGYAWLTDDGVRSCRSMGCHLPKPPPKRRPKATPPRALDLADVLTGTAQKAAAIVAATGRTRGVVDAALKRAAVAWTAERTAFGWRLAVPR